MSYNALLTYLQQDKQLSLAAVCKKNLRPSEQSELHQKWPTPHRKHLACEALSKELPNPQR